MNLNLSYFQINKHFDLQFYILDPINSIFGSTNSFISNNMQSRKHYEDYQKLNIEKAFKVLDQINSTCNTFETQLKDYQTNRND